MQNVRYRTTLQQGLINCVFVKNRLETFCTTRRQRECRQTNGLLSATMCQHSHYALLYTFRSRPLQIKILRSTFSANCCCIQFRTAHICSMFRKGNFSVIPTSTLNRGNCGIPKFRNRIEIHLPKWWPLPLPSYIVYRLRTFLSCQPVYLMTRKK